MRVKSKVAATGLLVGVISCSVADSKSVSQESWAALDGTQDAQVAGANSSVAEDPQATVAGDSLRIDFFDRKDLSGVFRVRTDGQISLPLIGSVYVKGMTLGQLEMMFAAAVREVTDHATSVTVERVERPPVYMVGYINKPNAYPYVENMTVLHALALGGGLYRALSELGLAAGDIEASRETAQLKQTLDVLKRSLAQLARLRSQRDGKSTIEPDAKLLQLCSKAEADELIAAEARVMEEQAATLSAQLVANARALQVGQEEIQSFTLQMESVKSQAELTRKDLHDAERLVQRGLIRSARVREIQRLVAQYEAETRNIMASIARAESNIANLSRDRELLTSERKLKIESEIHALEEKVAQSENALRSSRGLISKYTGMTLDSRMSVVSPRVGIKIVRGGVEGRKAVIDATETTPLLPGDIVQFILSGEQSQD